MCVASTHAIALYIHNIQANVKKCRNTNVICDFFPKLKVKKNFIAKFFNFSLPPIVKCMKNVNSLRAAQRDRKYSI